MQQQYERVKQITSVGEFENLTDKFYALKKSTGWSTAWRGEVMNLTYRALKIKIDRGELYTTRRIEEL